jgi:ubiquinone/menaquinone biosynthesis C-methylase UbiE
MMTDLSSYYRTASPSYDRLRFDGENEVQLHAKWFCQRAICAGANLLDIGCGTGRYTKAFEDAGLHAVGLDHSIDQLLQALRKVPARLGSALEIPFPDEHFDFCSHIMMLHQLAIDGLPRALSESHRVLKAGGCVWIKTCSHNDLRERPLNRYFPESLDINLKRYKDLVELQKSLEHSGFTVERSETVRNKYEMLGSEIASRVTEKHNSTLHLISEEGFRNGLAQLKSDFSPKEIYSLSHSHTLLELKK